MAVRVAMQFPYEVILASSSPACIGKEDHEDGKRFRLFHTQR